MKLTKTQLRNIIKEEIQSLTENSLKRDLSKLNSLAKKHGLVGIKDVSKIKKIVGKDTRDLVERGAKPISLFIDPNDSGTYAYVVNEIDDSFDIPDDFYRVIYSIEGNIHGGYIDELNDFADSSHVFWAMIESNK